MIFEFELAKSEQQIKEQWSFPIEDEGEPPGVQIAALVTSASTTRGRSQSDSPLSFPFVPFLARAAAVLVASCCLFYRFTIHGMLCICCIDGFPMDYALKTTLPCCQGWIYLVTVCSSGAPSVFLCFCYRTFLLSSCGNTFSVALYLLQ